MLSSANDNVCYLAPSLVGLQINQRFYQNCNMTLLQFSSHMEVHVKREMYVPKYNLTQILWCCRVVPAYSSYSADFKIGENKSNDVKIIIPSNITNHIAFVVSVQIIASRYFFRSCSINPQSDRHRTDGCCTKAESRHPG